MTQAETLQILKTGANVFLTGEPGSGKTYLINQYVSWLHAHGIAPAITASTGIAATHIGGMTIHSWSGIGIKTHLTKEDLARIKHNRRATGRISKAHVLIIDEISMLSAHSLDMVDQVCRTVRESALPFGGMQIILVGDFFQLPPVQKTETSEGFASRSEFAFTSEAWTKLEPTICYLTEQHRQEDNTFLEILGAFRSKTLREAHLKHLTSRKIGPEGASDEITKLFSHNADVDRVNEGRLDKLPGEAKVFKMTDQGQAVLVEQLKRGCLSPEILRLKVGAKVIFTKNSPERDYVNGTTGTVSGFDENSGFPIVEKRNGRHVVVTPASWAIEEEQQKIASISQIPLRLAWALTVHKSQGMSLDAAVVDLRYAFEYGQGYVALSRVRSLQGLHLLGLNQRSLEVHPSVLSKDAEFRTRSAEAAEKFAAMGQEYFEEKQKRFLLGCGGNLEEFTVSREPEDKTDTYAKTLVLAKEGKTIPEMAASRSLTEVTIISHLEELLKRKELSREELVWLVDDESSLREIHLAMRDLGVQKLKPIFEHFAGRFSYNTIRLAHLLYSEDKSKDGLE